MRSLPFVTITMLLAVFATTGHGQPTELPTEAVSPAIEAASTSPKATEPSSDASKGALPLAELQTFADVFHQIRAGYVEKIDDSQLFEYAVRGMLEGLDPHSAYLTKEDYSDL